MSGNSDGGAIINISSIFGRESGGKPTYNASKAAMISFTKSFGDEMIKKGIRVNGVAPGSILHETGNWKKIGTRSIQDQFVCGRAYFRWTIWNSGRSGQCSCFLGI